MERPDDSYPEALIVTGKPRSQYAYTFEDRYISYEDLQDYGESGVWFFGPIPKRKAHASS